MSKTAHLWLLWMTEIALERCIYRSRALRRQRLKHWQAAYLR
jgi:hypothetical protein